MSSLVVDDITNSSGTRPYNVTLSAENTTTGGTSLDFTNIPTGTTQITLMGTISTSGTSDVIFQLGSGEVFETSGYVGNVANQAATFEALSDGFDMKLSVIAARNYTFLVNLHLENSSSNTWYCKGSCVSPGNADEHDVVLGTKSLTGVLDSIRVTTSGGSDTIDGNSGISIQFQ